MKKELNVGKASMLLDKLIKDTIDNKLNWEKTSALGRDDRMDYMFRAAINDDFTAYIQNLNGTVFVWVERLGERIYINESLRENPSIISGMNKLHGIVKYFSNVQVMKEIDEYLGLELDESAYAVTEKDALD